MTERQHLERPSAWPALATLALVVLVWLGAPRVLPTLIGAADGSTYAALEALFSGLAFAGVVWTVLLQSRELALQRAELISTREEMARSRAESARTASAQEDAAHLAALVALIAHETDRMDRFHAEAYVRPVSSNQFVVQDERAAADYKDAMKDRFRYLDDLKSTYARITSGVDGHDPQA